MVGIKNLDIKMEDIMLVTYGFYPLNVIML